MCYSKEWLKTVKYQQNQLRLKCLYLKENFKFTLENLLEKDYLTIENDIISYIKNYN